MLFLCGQPNILVIRTEKLKLASQIYYITMQKRKNCACMNFSLCIWSGTYRKKNHTWASLLTIPTAYRKLQFSRVFSSEYSDIIFGNGSPISFHFFFVSVVTKEWVEWKKSNVSIHFFLDPTIASWEVCVVPKLDSLQIRQQLCHYNFC